MGCPVAYISPQSPGPAFHFGKHRHRGVVAMNALGGEHMRLDEFIKRQQNRRAGPHMIRQGRDRQLDALTRVVLALSIERLMIGVFVHQHHRQQARPRKTARNRMKRRRRLRDRLTGPAAELLPHMLGHEPLPWYDIEGLGDIFADLRQLGATTARAACWRRMNKAPARQVVGKVPTRRFAPLKSRNLDHRCCGLGRRLTACRGEFLKLQFQLIEEPLALLGARTKHLTLHLGDHQLKVLDQSLGAAELGARLNQRRLEGILVVGEMIGSCNHAHHISTIARDSPSKSTAQVNDQQLEL